MIISNMKTSLALLVCTICLLYSLSSASPRLNRNWWRFTEFYGLNVWTFKDSDGNGYGDLKGLISKLDYIQGLGVTTVKLAPIFSSRIHLIPKYGNMDYSDEYDGIDNFNDIHRTIGTLDDFDNLIKEAELRDMKIILDLPLHYCSCSHEWFEKSRLQIEPYSDYFIWKSDSSGADKYWKMDDTRGQMYFHFNGKFSADFNLRNADLKEEITKIIKFWFDRGVSGLDLVSANLYIKSEEIMTRFWPSMAFLKNLPESYDVVHELRSYVDSYNKENGGYERILIVEKNNNVKIDNLRGNETYPLAHIVTNNLFAQYKPNIAQKYIHFFTSSFQEQLTRHIMKEFENGPTLFIYEDEYTNARLATRMPHRETLNIWFLFTYMFPGTLHIYYGQEIGLYDWLPQFRFYQLYPYGSSMQWDDTINAGFTTSRSTKIPPNADYWRINVENVKNTPFSTYHMIRDLLKLRKTILCKYGDLGSYQVTPWIFAFARSLGDTEIFLIVLNLDNVINIVDLKSISNDLPDNVFVATSTPNSLHRKGDEIKTTTAMMMAPLSGVVIATNRESVEILGN